MLKNTVDGDEGCPWIASRTGEKRARIAWAFMGGAGHKLKGAREVALVVLYRVELQGSYADKVLDGLLKRHSLPQRDRALATELAFGTLRWRGKIDWALGQLLKGGIEELSPWIRNILRLGAYQLMFCDKIPSFAAVSESVELAKKYGHTGVAALVNGVLRKVKKEVPQLPAGDIESLAVNYSHPSWMVRRWVSRLGALETEELLKANNQVPPVSLRANALRVSREELLSLLEGEELSSASGKFSQSSVRVEGNPLSSNCYRQGLFQVQDEGATLVGELLAPQPDEVVVDLCSAPGGKATHLAELMGNRGLVLAVDINRARLSLVSENCKRLGVGIVRGVVADGRDFSLRTQVDRVLIDAPCSNLGVLRRRPDLRWRIKEEEIGELVRLQRALLEGGSTLLREGGILVYSTCTLEPEENEQTVLSLLDSRPEFALEDGRGFVPREVVNGRGWLMTLPHVHGLDGGFAARMRKAC